MGTGCSTGDRQVAVLDQGAAGQGPGADCGGSMHGFALVKFAKAYIRSMRLYYSFVTGIAGWLGVAYYEYLAGDPALPHHRGRAAAGEEAADPGDPLSELGCQPDRQ